MVRIRRAFGDTLISIATVSMLLVLLVSVNERVRQQVSMRLSTAVARAQLQDAGAQVRDMARVLISATRHQSIEHGPMMMFIVAGTVLFVFMMRT